MSRKPESHHVVPNADGGWDVRKGESGRVISHHDTKREAIDAGRKISRNQQTELFIHGRDGKFQERDSHGNDPYPPIG